MRRFCLALAFALTLVLPAPAPAWDGAQTLTRSLSGDVAVAGNEHGRRVFAWSHGRGVFVRVAPRGGRFGPRLRLADSGVGIRAVTDGRGDTLLVWSRFVDEDPDWPPVGEPGDEEAYCCVRLIGVVLRRDGRLSPPVDLGLPHAINSLSLLSTDGDGRVAIAWEILDESSNPIGVYARFGTMRRGFGEARLMAPPHQSGNLLAVGRGRLVWTTSLQTVETWIRANGDTGRRVLLDFPAAGGQLGTDDSGRQTGAWDSGETMTRTPPGPFETVAQREPGRGTRVSVAGSGAAAVAWTPGESASTPPTGLKAAVRQPDGDFAPALDLDPVATAYDITLDSLDAAPDGAAAVAATFWRHHEPDPILESRVYLLPAGGDGVERLTFPHADGAGVRVLRDARGTLAVMRAGGGFVARWVR